MRPIEALPYLLSVVGGLVPAVWLARLVIQGLDQENAPPPAWLEWMMPLKGRWLGYLLAAPAMAMLLTMVFLICMAALALLGVLIIGIGAGILPVA